MTVVSSYAILLNTAKIMLSIGWYNGWHFWSETSHVILQACVWLGGRIVIMIDVHINWLSLRIWECNTINASVPSISSSRGIVTNETHVTEHFHFLAFFPFVCFRIWKRGFLKWRYVLWWIKLSLFDWILILKNPEPKHW